jgi:hypothetical protein
VEPELPFVLAGAIAVAGGYRKEGKWPKNGAKAVLATGTLAVFASVSNNTQFAPAVRAVGWLAVLGSIVAYGNIISRKK